MRRYGPSGPIRPSGSLRSALGPPPSTTWVAEARRAGDYIQTPDRYCAATALRCASAIGGRRRPREAVLEPPPAPGAPGFRRPPHDRAGRPPEPAPPGGL